MNKNLTTINNSFIKAFIMALGSIVILTSCEEDFFPELEESQPNIVVDAWINNKPEAQTIKLTRTTGYFEAVVPPGIRNATVYINDDSGRRFVFSEVGTDGTYIWNPSPSQPQFGELYATYNLHIIIGGRRYTSTSVMHPVPEIDSVRFRLQEGNTFFPDSYFAEFFAKDLAGEGNTYWIKAWKNEKFLNKPSEINIAYDAGFTQGGNVDGIYFIQPIRDAINPFETDENDEFLSPYEPGDSVYVEIHSITNEAFTFLNELIIQTDRPGGFAELFAVPLSNVPTNIISDDPESEQALGFFCISAISSKGNALDPDNLPQ